MLTAVQPSSLLPMNSFLHLIKKPQHLTHFVFYREGPLALENMLKCAACRGIDQTYFMFSSYIPYRGNSVPGLCAHNSPCCHDSASQLPSLLGVKLF